jgi:hypothetical protein
MRLALAAGHFRVGENAMPTEKPRESTEPSVAPEADATVAEIEALQQDLAARRAEAGRVADRLEDAIDTGNEILEGERE